MAGTVRDVLTVAKRNLGFIEGPNNKNPYAPLVGHANHQPWCASFVAAVFKRAGVPLPSTSAYTPTMANGFIREGRWHDTGKAGDVVFFEWPSMGRIAHVGIVEVVEGRGTYICIEGNTDSAGGRTGGRVMRQVRGANIAGFGRPAYAAPRRAVPAKDPVLQLGDKGDRVKDVQRALVRGGFLKPKKGEAMARLVDGDFGGRTKTALVALQTKHKVKPTGTTTTATWAALRAYPDKR